jgi:hypothetical protein
MRTLTAVACLLAILCATLRADDPPAEPALVDIECYGESADIILQRLADSAGLTLRYASEDAMLDSPVWVRAKGVTTAEAAHLLEVATSLYINVQGGTLVVSTEDDLRPKLVTRGYDVSIAAGRYVDYVNTYGAPAAPKKEGEAEGLSLTAAERLARLLTEVADIAWGIPLEPTAVGDRILCTASAGTHALVQEFLQVMAAEHGGMRVATQRERAFLQQLQEHKAALDYKDTPICSIVAHMCRLADTHFVIESEAGMYLDQEHIDWFSSDETSCLDAMRLVLFEHGSETIQVRSHGGAMLITDVDYCGLGSERVFEVGDLLKKLDAAFQRQRTAPGKEDGYTGDIAREGGTKLIVDALEAELDKAGSFARVFAYGSRLVALGSAEECNVIEGMLKEMGWEPPKE